MVTLLITVDLHADQRLVIFAIGDSKRPQLFIFLDNILIVAPPYQSFGVIYSVSRVACSLILSWLTN